MDPPPSKRHRAELSLETERAIQAAEEDGLALDRSAKDLLAHSDLKQVQSVLRDALSRRDLRNASSFVVSRLRRRGCTVDWDRLTPLHPLWQVARDLELDDECVEMVHQFLDRTGDAPYVHDMLLHVQRRRDIQRPLSYVMSSLRKRMREPFEPRFEPPRYQPPAYNQPPAYSQPPFQPFPQQPPFQPPYEAPSPYVYEPRRDVNPAWMTKEDLDMLQENLDQLEGGYAPTEPLPVPPVPQYDPTQPGGAESSK